MAKKRKQDTHSGVEELKRELNELNGQLKNAYERFNYACEDELIEACIYEISALKARYNYSLRRIKELGGAKYPRRHAVPVMPPSAAEAGDNAVLAAGNMKGAPVCRL